MLGHMLGSPCTELGLTMASMLGCVMLGLWTLWAAVG